VAALGREQRGGRPESTAPAGHYHHARHGGSDSQRFEAYERGLASGWWAPKSIGMSLL
jgi:hypothetical protein